MGLLRKILDSLDVSFADFFAAESRTAEKHFYARAELSEIGSGPISYLQVGSDLTDAQLQILYEQYQPGADTGQSMLSHNAEEGGIVLQGRLEVTVGDQVQVLTAGDAYRFNSRLPHRFRKNGINCDLKFGCLDVGMTQEDLDYFKSEIERNRAENYPHKMEFVTRDELPDFIGSDAYIGGMVHRANGHLHPLNLCLGEAQAAEDNGARIFEQSAVTRIHHGAKPRIETAAGVMHANKVVLAGNAYLGKSEPRLHGKVIPAGSYIIATEPLSRELAKEILPQDMAACDQRVGLDYFRLSADRRLLFGGLCNYSGRHPKDITASLRPKMVKVFPQLESARIEYEWGGYIAITLKRIPQMGRIQGNTYYAHGYSGHGLAPTHIAGQILADTICGDAERFDVFDRIQHWKLPGGKWFANPALALGMLYYRLNEIL